MNPSDGPQSNAPVPSLAKMKRTSNSNDSRTTKSGVTKSSPLPPLDILQRPEALFAPGSKDYNTGYDSDNSTCRSILSSWKPDPTLIPDSSSEGEEQSKSPSETKRVVGKKKIIKSAKLLPFSLSQTQEHKFGEPAKLGSTLPSVEESNAPQTPPQTTISPEGNEKVRKSGKRLQLIRQKAKTGSPRDQLNEMSSFSLPLSSKLGPKSSGINIEEVVDIDDIDDDEVIVDDVKPETSGRSRSDLAGHDIPFRTCTPINEVIILSDEEEEVPSACAKPSGTDDKMDAIEIIENESDTNTLPPLGSITPRKSRSSNRDSRGNVVCVDLDSPHDSPKDPNSDVCNLPKTDGDFRGFGWPEKSSELDHDSFKENEKEVEKEKGKGTDEEERKEVEREEEKGEKSEEEQVEKIDDNSEPEDRDESDKDLTPASDKILTDKSINLKPCSVNCSAGKKEADHVLEKRLSGEEEDKANFLILRRKRRSTSIDDVGGTQMEAGKLKNREKSNSIDKPEETPTQVGKLRPRKKSNSVEKIVATPLQPGELSIIPDQDSPTVDEIPCVVTTEAAQTEEKSDAPEPEKKKRGRKPGFKCKPKLKKNSQQLVVEKVDKPDEHPCTSSGPSFRVILQSQADEIDAKLIINHNDSPVEKKKRGRKLGVKNKPKSERKPKIKRSPDRVVKRGRKKKSQVKPEESVKDNEDVVIHGCCIAGGCLHGNNYRKSGRLPSLPPNPEYIFAEKKYYKNLEEIHQQMVALETKDETDSGTGGSCSPPEKAYIKFPPTMIPGNPALDGKLISGIKVKLPLIKPREAEDSGSEEEEHEEDITQKPKIIQDEVFPKGALDHVLLKLNNGALTSNDSPSTPKRKEFGIRSTIPSRKALNPSTSSENIDAKIASIFNNNWKRIPEIAALLEEPPAKKICRRDSSDDTLEAPETKEPKRRRSLLSESVSNTDFQNGHTNASVLNGLFSDPHKISSSVKDHRRKKLTGNDNKYKEKSNIPPLTKHNLSLFDDAQDNTDVISHIMSQMQPPGKMDTNNTLLNPLHLSNKSLATSKYPLKRSVDTVDTKLRSQSRKRDRDINSLESPASKRLKKGGRWSINNNDDDASSYTSNESRPSAFASHKSLLRGFGKKGLDEKNELIAAWLDQDVANNEQSKVENSQSPHSAKTLDGTDYEDQLQIDETRGSNLSSPPKDDDEEDPDEKTEGNQSDNNSLSHSSTKTILKSLKESSSSGIGTEERDKQHSFETGDEESTRDASEVLPKANPPVKDNNKERDEEDEDALLLDYEEDDFLLDEPSENHKDEDKMENKQPAKKSSPVHNRVPPLVPKKTTKNPITVESPKRNPPVFNSPKIVQRNKPLDDTDEALERASTASDLYQMTNFERFASQTAREFNDQYSGADQVDSYEPDDSYDPYAPVKPEEECRIIFPKDPQQYFRGLCFSYLQKGVCVRTDCPFHNKQYSFHLQNLPKAPPPLIELVLTHAIGHQYFHLLPDIYPEAIKRLELRGIERICRKIHHEAQKLKTKANNFSAAFYQNCMKPTVEALMSKGYSPQTIINILCGCFLFEDDEDRKKLMRTLTATKVIPPGKHWDVLKDLIQRVDSSLPGFLVKLILDDCFKFDKPREYLQDIYEHVIKKTSAPTLMHFDQGLLRPFRPFFEDAAQPLEANNGGNRTPVPRGEEDFDKGRHDFGPLTQNNCSIASPDGNDDDSEKFEEKREEKFVTETRRKSIKERLGHRAAPIKPRNMEEKESYELIPIDRVSKPTSVYKESLGFLRLDLQNIQQSLKHRKSSRVIDILRSAKNQETQPFAKGFYIIFCKTVMKSFENLEAIIKETGNEFFEKLENGRYKINRGTRV